MLLKIGLVYLIGPSAIAIIAFEVLLNSTAMFNHANWRLPLGLDRVLRLVLVTPDMHRVHHSVHRHEHDSNYGFSLSIWDRMFGTLYVPDSYEDLRFGVADLKVVLQTESQIRPLEIAPLHAKSSRPQSDRFDNPGLYRTVRDQPVASLFQRDDRRGSRLLVAPNHCRLFRRIAVGLGSCPGLRRSLAWFRRRVRASFLTTRSRQQKPSVTHCCGEDYDAS